MEWFFFSIILLTSYLNVSLLKYTYETFMKDAKKTKQLKFIFTSITFFPVWIILVHREWKFLRVRQIWNRRQKKSFWLKAYQLVKFVLNTYFCKKKKIWSYDKWVVVKKKIFFFSISQYLLMNSNVVRTMYFFIKETSVSTFIF